MTPKSGLSNATIAKLLLVALAFCWGLSWTAMRVALDEVSPWAMRLIGYAIGAVTLWVLLKAQGRRLAIPFGKDWLHIFVAALFLAVSFGVAGSFAQLMANTSRVIIVNYSMPVWGSLMAYFVLHERINMRSAIGLVLCVTGLSVLVYPVAETSIREPIVADPLSSDRLSSSRSAKASAIATSVTPESAVRACPAAPVPRAWRSRWSRARTTGWCPTSRS